MGFEDSHNSESACTPVPCNTEDSREGRPQILIVDDCQVNRRIAQGMLRRLGYSADVAQGGREALAAIREGSYSLIFLDLQMPEMDGLEVARRIRLAQEDGVVGFGRSLRIVACTANVFPEDRAACFSAGMDEFLPKPLTPPALQAIVAAQLVPRD